MGTLERAIEIAARAHAGQVDKAGAPYVLHPIRVMLRVRSPIERMVAVLHDVVEDTDVTIAELEREGFPEEVIAAVEALTRRSSETYEEFVARAAQHPIAKRVKCADLDDNLDPARIANPTERDSERTERYRRAKEFLGCNSTTA